MIIVQRRKHPLRIHGLFPGLEWQLEISRNMDRLIENEVDADLEILLKETSGETEDQPESDAQACSHHSGWLGLTEMGANRFTHIHQSISTTA